MSVTNGNEGATDGRRGGLTVGPPSGATRKLVVVQVLGGVVQEVYCDDPEARIVLVDWDAEGCSEGAPNLVEVADARGRAVTACAAMLAASPTSTMPTETAGAVAQAS